jgi:hypothetical protein
MTRRQGLLLLLLLTSVSLADEHPGAVFLEIAPDARTAALGLTGVALTDLNANTCYNPAVLGFASRAGAIWSHANWLPGLYPGMNYEYAGASYRLLDRLGLGVSWTYLETGPTEVTGPEGQPLGEYRTFDMAPAVSAGYRLRTNLSVGISAKLVYDFLVPDWVWSLLPDLGITSGGNPLGPAFDAGIQYRPWNQLGLGLSVANIGPRLEYRYEPPQADTPSDPLPALFRLGAAFSPRLPGPVQVSLLADVSRDLVTSIHSYDFTSFSDAFWKGAGLELRIARLASVRFGYFEDIEGSRGGILTGESDSVTRVSLLDFLTHRYVGHVISEPYRIPFGLCWGVGLEFKGISADIGTDECIYDFPTRNVRFQLSYRF